MLHVGLGAALNAEVLKELVAFRAMILAAWREQDPAWRKSQKTERSGPTRRARR
jgi:hypothetical protein